MGQPRWKQRSRSVLRRSLLTQLGQKQQLGSGADCDPLDGSARTSPRDLADRKFEQAGKLADFARYRLRRQGREIEFFVPSVQFFNPYPADPARCGKLEYVTCSPNRTGFCSWPTVKLHYVL